ncbi:MAG TPA: sensor histidine kinase [Streptosporangiaceae bacterium]|nr:sensor histidine kinase [Streptosporangiaceae bacterium]
MTEPDAGCRTGGQLRHEAVYYHGPDDYRSAVQAFVRDGLSGGQPALVAVPGPAAELIRDGLAADGSGPEVTFTDMTQLGRNPGRIISAVWDFLDRHPRQPARFVAEPAWPGRSPAELRETALHESMLNRAFAALPVQVLCAYHVGLLAPRVIASATLTHPFLRTSGVTRPNAGYAGPAGPGAARPLPPPPARARRLAYAADVRAVREAVADYAERAGLTGERLADLIIAVSEVAANTTRHTSEGGMLHMWRTRSEVICETSDRGQITDPLVGRRRSPCSGGLGLWVVHQLCDLVELRTGRRGTRIRMHMRLDAHSGAGLPPEG